MNKVLLVLAFGFLVSSASALQTTSNIQLWVGTERQFSLPANKGVAGQSIMSNGDGTTSWTDIGINNFTQYLVLTSPTGFKSLGLGDQKETDVDIYGSNGYFECSTSYNTCKNIHYGSVKVSVSMKVVCRVDIINGVASVPNEPVKVYVYNGEERVLTSGHCYRAPFGQVVGSRQMFEGAQVNKVETVTKEFMVPKGGFFKLTTVNGGRIVPLFYDSDPTHFIIKTTPVI